MPKIVITDGSGSDHDVTAYYDSSKSKYSYTETYDPKRGRTKTATVELFNYDVAMTVPLEDNVIKIYRDVAGTDLVFGGVISGIEPTVIANDASGWLVNYKLSCNGYDPQTTDYQEVVNYVRSNIKAGQVVADLLTAYAPWISVSPINISGSPTVRSVNIVRSNLGLVIQNIVAQTGWTFYVDDSGAAYFDDPSNLELNWGLTEGTKPDYFPEFDSASLKIKPNTAAATNDVTIFGGAGKGSLVVETFSFNGQDAVKPLFANPFGLEKTVQFYDAFDQTSIDSKKWKEYPLASGAKISESSGRLQIASGVNATDSYVTRSLFSRDDAVELRIAEFEITSFSAGKTTIGVTDGSTGGSVTDFKDAFEFDSSAGTLHVRQGASVTNIAAVSVGAGIYGLRLRIKKSGGAVYFIQGGRTSTPKEYGELGSKTWTKVTETSSDTTAFLAVAIRADSTVGATAIRCKVATDVNVTATLLSGGKLGSGAAVASDTLLFVGLQQALDFETDCFVGTDKNSPYLSFFTDNIPLGDVRISYYQSDDQVRERVYSSTAKTSVSSRSALSGDDGTRAGNAQKIDTITDPQDARNIAIALINEGDMYTGSFETTSWHLDNLSPVGEKPIAGKLITVALPNTWGYASFSEIITSVTGTDLGTGDLQYEVQFGTGNIGLDRFLLRLRDKTFFDIIDDEIAAVDADAEDSSTAATARIATPSFSSSLFDATTGVQITWSAVSGAANYEVRDNLFKGQGQGGSLVYQHSAGTSYTISVANVKGTHKKRSFTLYVWAITAGGQYSKYPLVVTVENPAPVPQPIQDIVNPNGLQLTVQFSNEVEADILANGRHVQIDNVDSTFGSLVVDSDISKTTAGMAYTGVAGTTYHIRYGLKDEYTDSLGDIIYSGIREITTGAADFSGSKQFLNNTAPDNATTNLVVSDSITPGGDDVVTFTFDYTQGTNIATAFLFVFKIGGGTPSINDPSIMVPVKAGTGLKYALQMPQASTVSFAVIPVAVTRGGITALGSYQTSVNYLTGGANDVSICAGPAGGNVYIGTGVGSGNTNNVEIAAKFYLGKIANGYYFNATGSIIEVSKGIKILGSGSSVEFTGSGSHQILASVGSLTVYCTNDNITLHAHNGYQILCDSDIVPSGIGGGQQCGTSSARWTEVHGTAIYRGATEINSLYAAISHSHAKGDLPAAVAYEDEANTFSQNQTFSAVADASGGNLKVRLISQNGNPTIATKEFAVWNELDGGGGYVATHLLFNDGSHTFVWNSDSNY